MIPLLALSVVFAPTLQQSKAATASAPRALRYVPSPQSPIAVGPMAGRPELADMDRDGHLDVVVACGTCCGSKPQPDSGKVVVLLGDGKGGLRPTGPGVVVAPSARKLAVGDFDRDGAPDVAVALHDAYELHVLRNDGQGGLVPMPGSPITAATGPRPHTHDIAAGDVDGDRHLDLLSTNANDGTVSILLGDGKGGFRPAAGSPLKVARHPYDRIQLCDLDRDGRLDLVVPDLRGNAVVVLRNEGKAKFTPIAGSPFAVGERPGYVGAGDLNGDGLPDLMATHDDVGLVHVLLADGKGGFQRAQPVEVDQPVWGFVPADLDGDGVLDLAMGSVNNRGVMVLRGDGKAGFATVEGAPFRAGRNSGHVAVGDLDHDGRPDLVSGNYQSGDVSVLLAR